MTRGRREDERKEVSRKEGRRKQLVSVLWEESSHGDWREGERG